MTRNKNEKTLTIKANELKYHFRITEISNKPYMRIRVTRGDHYSLVSIWADEISILKVEWKDRFYFCIILKENDSTVAELDSIPDADELIDLCQTYGLKYKLDVLDMEGN